MIRRHEMRTMSSLPDLATYKVAEACRKEQTEHLKDVEGIILTMVFQPIASSTIKVSDAKGGTPMGVTAQNQQCKLPHQTKKMFSNKFTNTSRVPDHGRLEECKR